MSSTKIKVISSRYEIDETGKKTLLLRAHGENEGDEDVFYAILEEDVEDFIEPYFYDSLRDEILDKIRRSVHKPTEG